MILWWQFWVHSYIYIYTHFSDGSKWNKTNTKRVAIPVNVGWAFESITKNDPQYRCLGFSLSDLIYVSPFDDIFYILPDEFLCIF